MSDEFKDVSTVPTLTLKPFQEEEKKKTGGAAGRTEAGRYDSDRRRTQM